jgi:hypothetical protein
MPLSLSEPIPLVYPCQHCWLLSQLLFHVSVVPVTDKAPSVLVYLADVSTLIATNSLAPGPSMDTSGPFMDPPGPSMDIPKASAPQPFFTALPVLLVSAAAYRTII